MADTRPREAAARDRTRLDLQTLMNPADSAADDARGTSALARRPGPTTASAPQQPQPQPPALRRSAMELRAAPTPPRPEPALAALTTPAIVTGVGVPMRPISKPIRRRMRTIASCLECRRRKLKCDKGQPCTHCDKASRACVYLGARLDEASQLRLTQFKDHLGSLEHELIAAGSGSGSGSGVVGTNTGAGAGTGLGLQQNITVSSNSSVQADEGADDDDGLASLGSADLTYYDDDDDDTGLEDLVDLGVAVGRMRITDRVGGSSRPRLIEQISVSFPGFEMPPSTSQQTSPLNHYDFLQPGPSYIWPSNHLLIGQPSSLPSLDDLLPTRAAADRLMQQYFDAVHPVAQCLHRASFEAQYLDFWAHVEHNAEPRPALQALVFAVMFSAAVSIDEAAALDAFGRTKEAVCEATKLAAETSLSKANFLRATRFEVMQAFVIYLLPLCRDQVSRAHSVLVGAAVRMAECMGLHRDGETYRLRPIDVHIRRLVWHNLCFLDMRTCEAQGPKPVIHREDYDTRLPVNCDQDQNSPLASPVDRWTPVTLPLIRFEITEMLRVVWIDRRKIEARQMTLTAALVKIEAFRKRMLEKYDRHLDNSIPLQRYTRLVMNLLLYRLHVILLHPFFRLEGRELPRRLVGLLVSSAIMLTELGIQLERNPMIHPWAWYSGAYHQFQSSLILAAQLFHHQVGPWERRIWGCLDYVFDTDLKLSPTERGRQIFSDISYKTQVYQRIRKPRAPIHASSPPLSRSQEGTPPRPLSATIRVRPPRSPPEAGSPPSKHRGLSISEITEPLSPFEARPRGKAPDEELGASHIGQSSQAHLQDTLGMDWDTIKATFEHDPVSDEFRVSGYDDPSLTVDWAKFSWRRVNTARA